VSGSLRELMDGLEAAYLDVQAAAPELHVYRWWRPDVALPALYTWIAPGSTERPDTCTVRDLLRVTPSIAVDPTDTIANDAYTLEALIDAARDALDPHVYAARPFGQQRAKRLGISVASDRFGDAPVLVAELPIEVTLDRRVNP
jgi:hypothetical protein